MQTKKVHAKFIEISGYNTNYQCRFCKESFESREKASSCYDKDWKELNKKEKFCPLNCKHFEVSKKCDTCKKFDFCYPHINEPREMLCTSCWNTENNFKCVIKEGKQIDLYSKGFARNVRYDN